MRHAASCIAAAFLSLIAIGCGSPESDHGTSLGEGGSSGNGAGGESASASGAAAGAPSDDWVACTSKTAPPSNSELLFHLVLDVSASMGEPAGDGADSKWDVLRDSVRNFIDELPEAAGAGVMLFPNRETTASSEPRPTSACVNIETDITPLTLGPAGSEQRTKLAGALDSGSVGGASATHDACRRAHGDAGIGGTDQVIVLVTDGHPTMSADCVGEGTDETPVDAAPIVDELHRTYLSANVPSFVIGLPGSEVEVGGNGGAREWMSLAAIAGGTAPEGCDGSGSSYCHWDLSGESDLSAGLAATLTAIENQVTSCRYSLPANPPDAELDLDKVRALLTTSSGEAESLQHDTAVDCREGFRYVADGRELVLCPETCARVKADAGAKVTLEFGCTY